jgi:hypothetical protein
VLKIELHTNEIPQLFSRFKEVIDERYWLKRISSIKEDIKGHTFLANFLANENEIAFALAKCSNLEHRYGRIPMQEAENRDLYSAMSLAAQVLSIMDHSTNTEATKLVKRIRGAFKNPDDMRAIQLEIMAATHFAVRGHTISWPEMEGIGTYDLLIKDLGANGLEIECKSISEDKGRKVHQREALEFHHLVKPGLQALSQTLQCGVSVVLTLSERLPAMYKQKQALAKRVVDSVLTSQNIHLEDGSDIRISEFDMNNLGIVETENGKVFPREAIDQVTVTNNSEAMILGHSKGAIVFVLQSRQDDTMLKYVFDTVSESAKNQVSKTRPALFLVGLHGIEADSLLSIATQDSDPAQPPTALRIAVSNFLAKENRDHIIGVGFLSKGNLKSEPNGVVKSGGSAYIFPKTESSFWHQDFSGLFSERKLRDMQGTTSL